MKYSKFILVLILMIFVFRPVSSQKSIKNSRADSTLSNKLKGNDTNKTLPKKSPNDRYEFFVSFNAGGDPEAYTAYGMSIAFHIAPIIDLRTGMDGYIGNDYGDGLKKKYNVAYFGLYIGQYVYKDKIRSSFGGGVALLIRKLTDDDKKYHPFVNIKGEYFFTKNFGIGAEVKYYIKSIYSNSSALYFFNGNIKL
jgi:hypothetical protein